jgi:hypothetical protein
MVKMPAHQIAFVGPGFFLNRVIKNQHAIVSLDRSDDCLDLLPQVL